jgi:photosystem II stability/assembly factor-like uncharacterized protein
MDRQTESALPNWTLLREGKKKFLHGVWGTPRGLWVTGAEGILLYRGYEAEASWKKRPPPSEDALEGIWIDGSRLWVAGGSTVLSEEQGRWRRFEIPASLKAEAVWASGEHVILSGQGVYCSHNSGQSWSANALPAGDYHSIFGDDQVVLCASTNGTIARSEDRGRSWSTQHLAYQLWGLSGAASHLFAVGNDGLVLRSSDQGLTWEVKDAKTRRSLHGVWASPRGFVLAAGADGVIVSSEDFGESWREEQSGTEAFLMGAWGDTHGRLFVVGEHGVVLSRSRTNHKANT